MFGIINRLLRKVTSMLTWALVRIRERSKNVCFIEIL